MIYLTPSNICKNISDHIVFTYLYSELNEESIFKCEMIAFELNGIICIKVPMQKLYIITN